MMYSRYYRKPFRALVKHTSTRTPPFTLPTMTKPVRYMQPEFVRYNPNDKVSLGFTSEQQTEIIKIFSSVHTMDSKREHGTPTVASSYWKFHLPMELQNEPASFAFFFLFQAKGNCTKALNLAFSRGIFHDSITRKIIQHAMIQNTNSDICRFLIEQKDAEFLHHIITNSELMKSFWKVDVQVDHYEYITGINKATNMLSTPPPSPPIATSRSAADLHLNLAVMFCCYPPIYTSETLQLLLSKKYWIDKPGELILLLAKTPYDYYIKWVFEHARDIDLVYVLRRLVFQGFASTLNIALDHLSAQEKYYILPQLVPLAVVRGSFKIVKAIGDHGGEFSDFRLLNSYYTPGVGGIQLLAYLVSKCGDISAIDKSVRMYMSIVLPHFKQ